MRTVNGKTIGVSKLLLLGVFFCRCKTREAVLPINDPDAQLLEIEYIKSDSLLKIYCTETYDLNGYNCDSTIYIRKFTDAMIDEESKGCQDKNSYWVSFLLEEDYIHANIFMYRFCQDSVFVFRNRSEITLQPNLDLISSRSFK
jgi:hypothetical protein